MQYSVNSTNGTDGSWTDASATKTSVVFAPGKVYVREKGNNSNFRLVATLTAPEAPTSGVTFDVAAGTVTGLSSTYEYSINGGAYTTNASGVNFTAGPITVRTKATASALASAPQTVGTIADAAEAPGAASVAGTGSGSTKLTGLNDGTTYEYILTADATVPTDWSGATSNTPSGGTEIDGIAKGSNTYIHVRVKATSLALASQVKTLTITAAPQ